MEITKKDHRITKGAAIAMTKRYRNGRKKIVAPGLKSESILPNCEAFDRAGFDLLLAQKGCAGVRAYYAMNELEQVHLVFVGVDANGKDILPEQEGDDERLTNETGVILDQGARCPEECPTDSPLNS